MLGLLTLPIELLRIFFYALNGIADALRGRNRLRLESTVLINAPRDAVWRFNAADRMVLDGPPVMEISVERLPESADLLLTRVAVNGQPRSRGVSRETERDEARGVIRAQWLDHPLSVPPDGGRYMVSGVKVETTPEGTAQTMFMEMTVRSFRDRIVYPVGMAQIANRVKQQCEKEAGISNRFAELANHGLILSTVAF